MGMPIDEKVVESYAGTTTGLVTESKAAEPEMVVAQPTTIPEDQNQTEKGEN